MTHFSGKTVWYVTARMVFSKNASSFRAGVIRTYRGVFNSSLTSFSSRDFHPVNRHWMARNLVFFMRQVKPPGGHRKLANEGNSRYNLLSRGDAWGAEITLQLTYAGDF